MRFNLIDLKIFCFFKIKISISHIYPDTDFQLPFKLVTAANGSKAAVQRCTVGESFITIWFRLNFYSFQTAKMHLHQFGNGFNRKLLFLAGPKLNFQDQESSTIYHLPSVHCTARTPPHLEATLATYSAPVKFSREYCFQVHTNSTFFSDRITGNVKLLKLKKRCTPHNISCFKLHGNAVFTRRILVASSFDSCSPK